MKRRKYSVSLLRSAKEDFNNIIFIHCTLQLTALLQQKSVQITCLSFAVP